jgi:hypothetical protein
MSVNDDHDGTMWLENPAFVVADWSDPLVGVDVEFAGAALVEGLDYVVGYELT